MPSLKDIRGRIASIKNTQKITSAMKMVAAAKLKRAQDAVEAARPYATKMTHVIDELVQRVETDSHPLLHRPEQERKIMIVVVSSDRGLCGGFNSALFRNLERFIADKKEVCEKIEVVTVGRKARQYFGRRYGVEKDFAGILGAVSFDKAKQVAAHAMERFKAGEVDHVYLAYNEFQSAITIIPRVEAIMPLSAFDEVVEDDALVLGNPTAVEYIYEPDEQTLLDQLLPNSVEIRIFQAILESEASEHGSRMTAMDNATNNANDIIQSLTLQYNRARQAFITKELVEIVSGAEALKG